VAASFAFERFVLDTRERQLRLDERPVELNGRYLDALALLVRDSGKLVSKGQFLDEVWRGVPVTDEALTQCIRTLRRQLGDDASRPRFIETVPKHGYRFIAPVQVLAAEGAVSANDAGDQWRQFIVTGSAGTVGGAAAGVAGGLVYGFAGASTSSVGAISVLLVLLCVTLLVAVIGGAGVSFAIATAALARTRSWIWLTLAGAAGGLFVGAFGKLLGLDSFSLLVGRSPGDITGAMEGLLLGAAVGLSAWLAFGTNSLRRGAAFAGLSGATAGLVIALLGGRLMLGSLALLADGFPGSRLRVDQIGRLFGETGIGPVTQVAANALEGALFSGCVVAAMVIARRRFGAN
jgi:DNA-binding winged helix-turn-helix (wHTH) protein